MLLTIYHSFDHDIAAEYFRKTSLLLLLLICSGFSAFAQGEQESDELFDSKAFYELSDSAFYFGVCNPNNSNYKTIKDWSDGSTLTKIGNRIKVIQRLDSLLTRMSDNASVKMYNYFENYSSTIKDYQENKETYKRGERKKGYHYITDSLYIRGIKELYSRCNLDAGFGVTTNSEEYLSYLTDYANLQRMYITYEAYVNDLSTSKQKSMHISPADAKKHLQLIANRMHEVEGQQFTMYQTYSASSVGVKAFNFNHGNDFLGIGIKNQDQDMTGSFRFEFSTDQFKARWLNTAWLGSGIWGCNKYAAYRAHKLKNPKYSMLSYQNISVGGDGYTPYIRYKNNFELADTMHQHDRPFGSYMYIERRKFRLWPSGLVRHNGTFQIGMLGLMSGQYLQAELHKDAIYDSQKVYGWEKQVGYGGRWLMQINHEVDLMLFSATNKFASLVTSKKPRNFENKASCNEAMQTAFGNPKRPYAGLNVILNAKAQYGGYLTAFTTGLTFSTLDFLHQSGHYVITTRRNNLFDFGWHLEAGIKYRYVVHNSMLQGLGYVKTFPDDAYDDESESVYVLDDTQINRNLLLMDFKVVLQWRKMTFYYQLNLSSIEYRLSKIDLTSPEIMAIVNNYAAEDPDFSHEFNTKIAPEFMQAQDRNFYGYGVAGMTWWIR